MKLNDLYHWLILKSVKGLGERSIKRLYLRFKSAERILGAKREELATVLDRRKLELLERRSGVDETRIGEILKIVESEGIGFITLEDDKYPPQLKGIPDPPPILFYRGVLRELPLIGVVGTRKPTHYTLNLVDEVVKSAVMEGNGVVSGGAKGVDTRAHTSTIEQNGYTVCVLGFGILRAKGGLIERIEKSGGLILSEFLPTKEAGKHTFPRRNRIIAGLTRFLIIPEAGIKSGALITASYAFKYGRKVFVHIGLGGSSNWDGCYRLVREGKAELFKDAKDIFGTNVEDSSPLLEFLKIPRTYEEIRDFIGKDDSETLSILTELEMKGKVRRIGSHYTS